MNGEWMFDRQDLCVYQYYYYPDCDQLEPSTLSFPTPLTPESVWREYQRGARDFSCRAVSNNADFSCKSLPEIDFNYSKLAGVNFEGSDLRQANFRDANMFRVNMRNTKLAGASFEGAELRIVDFSGADLTNVNFGGSKIGKIQLQDAIIRNTQFFEGILLTTVKPDYR
ncbi:pentapeptide repeat-containing protein [Acaryochloris thomasi]|uniref:pentapeptide repeat-containing protein n=1 Tax=Acaryochloris thomasi TaxID=2929456 RepID=UPI0011B39575|nr:pentapeptide repeat-containing protein [Acaryochloris thomasi]